MKKQTKDLVKLILESDLPTYTQSDIVERYLVAIDSDQIVVDNQVLNMVKMILRSGVSIDRKNQVVRKYLLALPGETKAIIQKPRGGVGSVERPSAEEIEIEENPRLKAEYRDTEKLMRKADKFMKKTR